LPAAVLGVAAMTRFHAIARSSYWSDEGNTWALVQRTWAEIAAAAAADIHPPGYYWLLKLWSLLFGTGEAALRSFSALCGLLLVWTIWALARQAGDERRAGSRAWTPLLAAWVAALIPFQIFYGQEARMYMLLALQAALLFLLLLRILPRSDGGLQLGSGSLVAYAIVAAAGMWTQYSFPIVLAAATLAWLLAWLQSPRSTQQLVAFIAANGAALLIFLPWLPTALRQITTWPQGGESIGGVEGSLMVLHTLLFGLMRTTPVPEWPWLTAMALLAAIGVIAWRRSRALPALLFWLGAPIALMVVLGLFSEAFLKFLLVASAPWCLLVAAAGEAAPLRLRPIARSVIALGVLALALLSLPGYYTDPTARDNYKGVARWLAATADPSRDLVVLNAPGQADVWAIYDPGLPVLALPTQRPADAGSVASALAAATEGKRSIYALLWATDESDPAGFVEGWLQKNLYRGAETWQGNVRLAQFRNAPPLDCTPSLPGTAEVVLAAYCLPGKAETGVTVSAGDPLPIELHWQAESTPASNLVGSIQLLDARGQVVAQIDAPPGANPTSGWQTGDRVTDRRALLIPDGTPPGAYRLIAVLYDPATGLRVPLVDATAASTAMNEVADLGAITVTRPAQPPPLEFLPVHTRTDRTLGTVRLLGYAQHKTGFAHAPETPLRAGDLLHVTLFWQAPDPLPPVWPDDATFTLQLADQAVTLPLAGGLYPTSAWQPGEVVRVEVDIPVSEAGARSRPQVTVAGDTLRLGWLPR